MFVLFFSCVFVFVFCSLSLSLSLSLYFFPSSSLTLALSRSLSTLLCAQQPELGLHYAARPQPVIEVVASESEGLPNDGPNTFGFPPCSHLRQCHRLRPARPPRLKVTGHFLPWPGPQQPTRVPQQTRVGPVAVNPATVVAGGAAVAGDAVGFHLFSGCVCFLGPCRGARFLLFCTGVDMHGSQSLSTPLPPPYPPFSL